MDVIDNEMLSNLQKFYSKDISVGKAKDCIC